MIPIVIIENLRALLPQEIVNTPPVAAAIEALVAVHEMHQPGDYYIPIGQGPPVAQCQECGKRWPCATWRRVHPPVPAGETPPNTQVQP